MDERNNSTILLVLTNELYKMQITRIIALYFTLKIA
jgi:hypothetical protein